MKKETYPRVLLSLKHQAAACMRRILKTLQKSCIIRFFTGKQQTYISDPLTWLRAEYSSSAKWSVVRGGTLEPGIKAFKQSMLEPRAGNCSLTAIAAVIYYYRHAKGYNSIDAEIGDIYDVVRKKAVERGYTAEHGTDFWDIDNILTAAFSAYGCKVRGHNTYLDLWNSIKSEITAKHSPVIMSMTGGYYNDHTVTVIGWLEFSNSEDGGMVRFLKIHDGWTAKCRYLDYEKITLIKNITRTVE